MKYLVIGAYLAAIALIVVYLVALVVRMTAREIKRLMLYEGGADSMPGPKLGKRRAYWHLWAAWMGWPA